MTDDEQCGAETRDGHPCKLPADSCPHHDDESRWPQKLRDREEDILAAARRGTTQEGCARAAGIDESTLYDYINRFPEFSKSFKRARSVGETELLEDDDTTPEFVLERSYGYTKTETHEHTGEDGGPVEVSFNEEVVGTEWAEENHE